MDRSGRGTGGDGSDDGGGSAAAFSSSIVRLWAKEDGAQGSSSRSQSLTPLTRRPASFSVNNDDEQPSIPTARARAGSCTPTLTADLAEKAGARGGSSNAAAAAVANGGFPLLVRGRTFAFSPKRRCYDGEDDGRQQLDARRRGGGWGFRRGFLSMSESNMLSLVTRSSAQHQHQPQHQPQHQHQQTPVIKAPSNMPDDRAQHDMNCSNSVGGGGDSYCASMSNSSSGSISGGDDALDGAGRSAETPVRMQVLEEQEQQQQWPPPASTASAERARRNAFVMRLHRAGLVQDTSRCVMDIVEGRAAAAAAAAAVAGPGGVTGGVAGVRVAVAPPMVTLEEVKEHLQSLPERYALSVDPEDVLAHMALAADVTAAAPVTATAPALPPVRVLVEGNDGSGGGGGGSDAGVGRERYTVTVACPSSPLLLEAVSSSLRSAGATCLDVDVVTKAPKAKHDCGVSFACLVIEVQGGCYEDAFMTDVPVSPSKAAAFAAATESASPLRQQQQQQRRRRRRLPHQEESNNLSAEAARAVVLAEMLASTIAGNLLAGERRDSKGAVETKGEGKHSGQGKETARGGGGEGDGGGGGGSGGGGARAGADGHPLAPTFATSPKAGKPAAPSAARQRQASAAGRSDSTAATHRQDRNGRGRLARRQGGFFLADADDSALYVDGNSDSFSFGGGGGGGFANSGGGRTHGEAIPPGASSNHRDTGDDNKRKGITCTVLSSNERNLQRDGCSHGAPPPPPPTTAAISKNDSNSDSEHNNIGYNHRVGGDHGYLDIPPEDIELLDLAGKGRFSRTYRARWGGMTVAVKIVELPQLREANEAAAASRKVVGGGTGNGNSDERSVMIAEFERELNIVRGMRHPNVCRFRGVCVTSPNQLSLVYDFLANGTLDDRLHDTGGGGGKRRPHRLQSTDLVRIVKDVVDGMLYLHELGVLHRDVKPDNILLDADDRAVIADFGLSRFLNPSGNDHTAETGTYRWMAPEVIRHEPYSQAADVYSFGVVLWQVLTRRRPFESLTPIQAAFSVARQGLRPPIPRTAPHALSSLIRRCWDQSPGARPSFSQIRSQLPEIESHLLSL